MSRYEDILKPNFRLILKGQILKSSKSHTQLAEETGLNRNTIGNMVNSGKYEPEADTIIKVCNAIGFDVEKLFKEEARAE